MKPKVLLCFPPCFYPHMPYLGTALLKGSLEEAGLAATQVDLNVQWYRDVLTPDAVLQALGRTWASCQKSTCEQDNRVVPDDIVRGLAGLLPQATEAMRPHSDVAMPIEQAQATIDLALDVVSSCYASTRVSMSSLRMRQLHRSTEGVSSSVADPSLNPFLRFLAHRIPAVVDRCTPDIVGVSIDVPDQIVPGFTLCRVIRDAYPSMKILLGGNVVTRLAEALRRPQALRSLYDVVVTGEGERAIVELAQNVDNTADIIRDSAPVPVNPDTIPCPSFGDLDLDDYFCRQSVLPVLASRRCYWDKCEFCSISHGYSPTYRRRSPAKVADDIISLRDRHNVRFFKLVDDAAAPTLLSTLADELISRSADVEWEAYTILEGAFADRGFCDKLRQAGCRWLYFGMETADPELTSSMNKRHSPRNPAEILRAVHEAGIGTHIWVIIGFPGDNQARVRTTVDFIERHREAIDSIEVNQFVLARGAPILTSGRVGSYGIRPLLCDGEDLALTYDFDVTKGMGPAEARDTVHAVRRHLVADLGYQNMVRSTLLDAERFA